MQGDESDLGESLGIIPFLGQPNEAKPITRILQSRFERPPDMYWR